MFLARLFMILTCISMQDALKFSTSIESNLEYGTMIARSFGLAVNGKIRFQYQINSFNLSAADSNYFLILIVSENQRINWYAEFTESSKSLNYNIPQLCSQPSIYRRQIIGNFSDTFIVDSNIGSDYYSVLALNCKSTNSQKVDSLQVITELTNPRPYSSHYNQLSVDEVPLPRIYEGALITYCLLGIGFAGQFVSNLRFVLPIHWLFGCTLCSILVAYAVQYYQLYDLNKNGENSSSLQKSLQLAVNILNFIASALGISTLLLLSLGWSLVRSIASKKERRIIGLSLISFIAFGMAATVCKGSGMACSSISLLAFVIKSLILLTIIIAMNFTVTQLRSMLAHSPWVPSTPIQYIRVRQYQAFRLIFILYLLLPTAFLLVQVTVYSWREAWVTTALNEILQILFIFHIGVTFGPLNESWLIRAFDGSLNHVIRSE